MSELKIQNIHHLNCATLCPIPKILSKSQQYCFCCHCLLLETNNRLILIDTGLGTKDILSPQKRLGSVFMNLIRPKLAKSECAKTQIKKLGFDTKDVQDILLTHLDPDHVGGISDFPHARIHVARKEFESAHGQKTYNTKIMDLYRYHSAQWNKKTQWKLHHFPNKNGQWKGFDSLFPFGHENAQIQLISLPGHSAGHCGVLLKWKKQNLFHVGDSYYNRQQLSISSSWKKNLSEKFYSLATTDKTLYLETQKKIAALIANKNLQVISSHDWSEFPGQ